MKDPKIYMEPKRPRTAKAILRKNKKQGKGYTLPHFNTTKPQYSKQHGIAPEQTYASM